MNQNTWIHINTPSHLILVLCIRNRMGMFYSNNLNSLAVCFSVKLNLHTHSHINIYVYTKWRAFKKVMFCKWTSLRPQVILLRNKAIGATLWGFAYSRYWLAPCGVVSFKKGGFVYPFRSTRFCHCYRFYYSRYEHTSLYQNNMIPYFLWYRC